VLRRRVADGTAPPLSDSERRRDHARAGARGGAWIWWLLLVVPLWVVLVLCTYWEPVMGDGWGHVGWHRANTVGPYAIYEFAREIYLNENPRLGQLLTMLIYTRGPYHVIATPLVELGVFAMLTVLALGRWPSLRRSDDALVAAIITATIASCTPQIGPMLFYRPFTGNYTFGLALNLLWLVPYRLEVAEPRAPRLWLAPPMLVLGLAAGLSNEHTGFSFFAMGAIAAIVAARRRGLRVWMIAGLVGLGAGYWLLLTAPGQHVRYGGLAEQATIFERIVDRGVTGNLRVIGLVALAMVWALPLFALGLIERWRGGPPAPDLALRRERWTCAVLALAGAACAVTLLGSPKIGPRLYFASIVLISTGLAGWLAGQLRSAWSRRAAALLAAGVLIFVAARLIVIHRVVGPLGALRRARIEHGAPGSVVKVPAYPIGPSRYFLGDDFAAPRREALAADYGLKAIELESTER
jgi:hypothetical protein